MKYRAEHKLENRQRVLGFCDPEKRIVERAKIAIERAVGSLSDLEIKNFVQLDQAFGQCEAIVLSGPNDGADPIAWLKKTASQFSRDPARILTPVIIVSQWDFSQLNSLLQLVIDQNWYFDILHPDHISSLPVRIANLIRISEHLAELRTYDRIVRELQQKIDSLEAKLME